MVQRLRLPMFAIFASISLAACSKGPSVVGTWTGSSGPATVEVTFEDGGKFSQNAKASIQGTELSSKSTGTWKLDDKKLTLTVTDIQLGELPAAMAPFKDQILKATEGAKNKPMESTLDLSNPDQITINTGIGNQSSSITLTRKK